MTGEWRAGLPGGRSGKAAAGGEGRKAWPYRSTSNGLLPDDDRPPFFYAGAASGGLSSLDYLVTKLCTQAAIPSKSRLR